MVWLVKTYPAQSTGLESKKISSGAESVFLDFPFYRTDICRSFATLSLVRLPGSLETTGMVRRLSPSGCRGKYRRCSMEIALSVSIWGRRCFTL